TVDESDPAAEQCREQRHNCSSQIERAHTHTAGQGRGHLAVVIQPPQSHDRAQQHSEWQDDGQVAAHRQPDQRQHDFSRNLAVGGAAQHEGKLISDKDDQQHERYCGRRNRNVAQYVAEEDSAHYQGASARREYRNQGSTAAPKAMTPAASRCCSKMLRVSAPSCMRSSTRRVSPVAREEARQAVPCNAALKFAPSRCHSRSQPGRARRSCVSRLRNRSRLFWPLRQRSGSLKSSCVSTACSFFGMTLSTYRRCASTRRRSSAAISCT